MRWLRSLALAALILVPAPALAQTNPNLTYGQVLTPAQWNNLFASKQDYLGAPPLLTTGGTMTGKIVTSTPNTSVAGLTLPHGTAPTVPINGDMWTTSSGLFVRINGGTVGPLIDATGSAVIVIGATPISGGTTTRVLYDNAGAVGEYAISGTGSVAMTTSPTFVTPTLGVASATSLAAGACTIGSNTLCSQGTSNFIAGVTLNAALTYGGVTLSNAVTGTGSMVLSTAPALTTPALGVATGTSLALNGCTIGANAFCTTGTAAISSTLTSAAITVTSTSANALAVGRQGATNPVLQVDASTATVVTGIKITGAASGAGVAVAAISSATNENLTVDAKGSGTITVGGTSTGAITLTRATTMSAALTYGGVTLSNSVVGTGSMVLSSAPSIAGLTVTSSFTATGLVGLGSLANIGANTVISNWTAGSAAPAANTWPACAADGLHALTYTNGTGVLCTALTTGGAGTVTMITAGNGITLSSGATCITTCTITNSGIGQVVIQKFTANGTYTPTSGMLYAIVDVWAGGGGGGGGTGTAGGTFGGNSGGNGSYSQCRMTAAQIGASKAVVIGAGGNGASAGDNVGSAGADTTLGSTLCVAKGGSGGDFSNNAHAPTGGAGGIAGTGDVTSVGNASPSGIYLATDANIRYSICANPTTRGGGVVATVASNSSATGPAATANTGNGGCGGLSQNTASTFAGGNGGSGYMVITEFVAP